MATVEELARHLAGLSANEDEVLLVGQWINERWKELANTNTLKTLRRRGELTVNAPYQTGTIDVTLGSAVVTGTGTAFSSTHVGQFFKQRSVWYEISDVASDTSLILKTPYTEGSATSAGYNIVQRSYKLSNDIRKLAAFKFQRTRSIIVPSSMEGLDLAFPGRISVTGFPQFIAEVDPDVDGSTRIEIYPAPNQTDLVNYLYWRKAPDLAYRDQLPNFIDIEAFREGVMVDVMRHAMFKAAKEGKQQLAELMRNEYRAQESRWLSTHKHRVLAQDAAVDDLEFILLNTRAHPQHTRGEGIWTAYDQVWLG